MHPSPTFWQFLCGSVPGIVVRTRRLAIPPAFSVGDYARDPEFRRTVQQWLEALWREKDAQIETLQGSTPRSKGR